jgi:Leucine-rich repeat (LRR) protein
MGVLRLAELSGLKRLELDHTEISEQAIESLARLPALIFLSLNGTNLTDAAVEHLAKIHSLRRLNVLGAGFSRTGMDHLQAELPQCELVHGFGKLNVLDFADAARGSILEQWLLRDNVLISPEPKGTFRSPIVPPEEYDLEATVMRLSGTWALVFAIVVGGRQTMVGFDHNPDQGSYTILQLLDGKYELESAAKTRGASLPLGRRVRVEIRVRKNRITAFVDGRERLDWTGDFSRLSERKDYASGDSRTLGLGDWSSHFAISDWTLTPVTGQADIVPLGPTRSRSEHELAKRIQSLGGSMEITRGGLTPESLEATSPLPEEPFWVREITVPAESRLTSDFFALLRRTNDLRVLRLNGAAFEASHFAQLRDLKWLGSLELYDAEVTADELSLFAELPRLDALTLRRAPQLSEPAWKGLGNLASLRSLDLGDAQIGDEAAEHLSAMSGLRKLNLSGTRITNATVEAIRTLTDLIELDLSRTAVTEDARESLAELTELRRLNLKDTALGFQAVEQLRQSLPDCVIEGPAWAFLIGESEPLRPMVTSGEAVDLLALIDLDRDAEPGTLQFDGQTLVSQRERVVTLKIPYIPPEEYRIEALVEWKAGVSEIKFGLPVGNYCFMELDGWPGFGYISGPYMLDRRGLQHHANHTYRGRILSPSDAVRVSCTVLRTENAVDLRVARGDEELFSWRGDPSSMSLNEAVEKGRVVPGALGLRTWETHVKISELRLIPISGSGRAVTFADPQENPELAAAQRVLWKGGRVAIDVAGKTQRIDTFSALPAQFTIREIDSLGLPSFTSSDLHWFRNLPHLREMALCNVLWNGADWAALTDLPALHSLVLQAGYLDVETASHLRSIPQLRRLDLSGSVVDDEALDVIGQMAGLRELRLDSSGICDDGLAKLAGLGNLTLLHLDATSVTDRGIETLRAMPKLTELSLQGTAVGDAATGAFSSLTSLRTLRLLDTAMTAPAVARLEQQLSKCRISVGGSEALDLLQVADPISGSIHGDWRLVNGALISPIEAPVPAKFRLPVIPPEEYDIEMTARRLSKSGGFVSAVVVADRRAMVTFDHYDHVVLQYLDGKGDLNSEAKSKRKSFPVGQEVKVTIRVRTNRIGVEIDGATALDWTGDFSRLSPNPFYSPGPGSTLGLSVYDSEFALSRLVLKPVSGSVRFDPRHASPPVHGRWVAARVLELGGFVRIADGGTQTRLLAPGTELPNRLFHVVEISGLRGTELTEEDLRKIGRLGQLQMLNLEGAKFDATYLGMLTPLSSLQTLNLNDTSVTDQELARFSALTSLRELRLARTAVSGTTFEELSNLHDLTSVYLGASKLTIEGFKQLPQFKRLRDLGVSGLKLTDDDLEPLADLADLEYLHVGWSNLTGPGLVHLSGLPRLRKLDLSGAPLTDEGLASLGQLEQIQSLLLAKTPITDEGLAHLMALPQLIELDLTGTKVTEQGALMLLKHLPKCVILLDGKRLTQPSYER